ncbi:carbohydrate sulfotransferase 15-like [Haliotis asinina]|uniref:carbohydrate sulfotransferase 15-like n=1 Tax=Haliotis asinina TaxID=109174 RepID=UPI0035327425
MPIVTQGNEVGCFAMRRRQNLVKWSIAAVCFVLMYQWLHLLWREDSHRDLQRIQHDPTLILKGINTMFDNKVEFLRDASHHITWRRDIDLMMLPQLKTLPEFTSPCWWVRDLPQDNCPRSMKYNREAQAWFAKNRKLTGETKLLRCLPYFFIIGQCKCGTSDLFARINRHPDVALHALKETQWIRRLQLSKSCSSIDTYLNLLQRSATFIQMNHREGAVNPYIIGDATPAYFSFNEFWDMLPGNEGCKEPCVTNPDLIHHLNPRAKLILSLRNPTKRLYSYYFHKAGFTRRNVSTEDFHDLVVREINIFEACLTSQSLRSCCYNYTNSYSQTHEIDLQRGIYHVFLSDWLKVFPREQLYVLKFEEYSMDVSHNLAEIFKFLKLRTLSDTELKNIVDTKAAYQRRYGQDVGDMLNKTRNLLDTFYRPHNKYLSELMERPDLNW